jgi:hypothetical protein
VDSPQLYPPPFVPPAFVPPPPPVPSRRPLLIAGLSGLVLGAVVVGALWLGTVLSPSGGNPEITAACDLLAKTPTLTTATLDQAHLQRIQVVAALATESATDDRQYQQLAKDSTAAVQGMVYGDLAGANRQLAAARKDCDDL